MTGIYLLLGSNLGQRERILEQAKAAIATRIAPIEEQSFVYQTASWELPGAPDFLNQVVKIRTRMNPYAVLYQIISIEITHGRQFNAANSSRYLDIDILYYDDLILNTDLLTIPHPRIAARRFALKPMVELAPHGIHPVLQKSQLELWENCTDRSEVIRLPAQAL